MSSDRSAAQSSPNAYQLVPSGFPPELQGVFEASYGEWNDPQCNTDGKSFPKFQTTAGTGVPTVPVYYSDGLNPKNSGSCGFYDAPTNSVHVFGVFQMNGYNRSCKQTAEQFQQTISHELGHVLGLQNVASSCNPAIMSPRSYDADGRYKDREVTTAECQEVAETHLTTEERGPIRCGTPLTASGSRRIVAAIDDCDDGGTGGSGPGGGTDTRDPGSPIVVDLDRGGFRFTSVADGVLFDLDADGVLDRVAWTAHDAGDGFLALDHDANGWIDDGSELFGDVTEQPASAEPHGFRALAVFDNDGDGWITAADPIFRRLRLWVDLSHDGQSQPMELLTLRQAGVEAISVEPVESRRFDLHGNQLRYKALVRLERSTTQAVDVFLRME